MENATINFLRPNFFPMSCFRANGNKRNSKKTKVAPSQAELLRLKLRNNPGFKPKILLLGDSHVKRNSQCVTLELNPHEMSFLGISGLDITNWQRFLREVPEVDVIVIQAGGNDVSQHPLQPHRTPMPAISVKENLKSLVRVLLQKTSLVLFTSPLLALQIRRQFGSNYLALKTQLEDHCVRNQTDTVHKSERTYREILGEINSFLTFTLWTKD